MIILFAKKNCWGHRLWSTSFSYMWVVNGLHFFIICIEYFTSTGLTHQEQLRVPHLAHEHFNILTGGAGDVTPQLVDGCSTSWDTVAAHLFMTSCVLYHLYVSLPIWFADLLTQYFDNCFFILVNHCYFSWVNNAAILLSSGCIKYFKTLNLRRRERISKKRWFPLQH